MHTRLQKEEQEEINALADYNLGQEGQLDTDV